MSNFVPEKMFSRVVLLHYFNTKKNAAESPCILVKVYGEHALAERTCQKWFARFKRCDPSFFNYKNLFEKNSGRFVYKIFHIFLFYAVCYS